MSSGYFNRKTHISLENAINELKITKSQFKSLIIFLNIRPQSVSKSLQIGSEMSSFKIKDINKIYNSEIYKLLLQNNKIRKKKDFFRSVGRIDLAEKKSNDTVDYIEIIKNKYKTFSDAVHDLGETITFLYLYVFLYKTQNIEQENEKNTFFNEDTIRTIEEELNIFENILIENKFIKYFFPSKNGVHLQLLIECVEIIFFVPFQTDQKMQLDIQYEEKYMKLYLSHLMMVNSRFLTMNVEKKEENAFNKLIKVKLELENSVYEHWVLVLLKYFDINQNEEPNIIISEGPIVEKKENVEYVHPAWLFSVFNKKQLELIDNFKIGKFDENNINLCHPRIEKAEFDQNFLETLSKTKLKTIDQYLNEMQKETFFK